MSVEMRTGVVPHDHVVQFFSHDDELVESAGRFLVDGLLGGDAVIVVAAPEHVAAFEAAINSAGIDVGLARDTGMLVIADAAEVLSANMIDGHLDPDRFATVTGGLVAGALESGRRVRIYGEMVALLWDAGRVGEAIELEALWNELGRDLPFSLFCGYQADSVTGDDHADSFRHVCHLHSAVITQSSVGVGATNPSAVARAEDARSFACELYAPSAARHFVADTLMAWGWADLVDDASIVVAELATNAVVHARSEFVVAVSTNDDVVRFSLRDGSTTLPIVKPPDPRSISGRGLMLVATIARRWGIELITDGKVVWAELAHG